MSFNPFSHWTASLARFRHRMVMHLQPNQTDEQIPLWMIGQGHCQPQTADHIYGFYISLLTFRHSQAGYWLMKCYEFPSVGDTVLYRPLHYDDPWASFVWGWLHSRLHRHIIVYHFCMHWIGDLCSVKRSEHERVEYIIMCDDGQLFLNGLCQLCLFYLSRTLSSSDFYL